MFLSFLLFTTTIKKSVINFHLSHKKSSSFYCLKILSLQNKNENDMKKLALILIVYFLTESVYAQIIPQVNIPLSVTDGIRSKVLYFGLDPTATNGIDPHLDEMEQPPLPPSGIFDARFIGQDINLPELGEGLLKDYRQGSSTYQGQHIHEIRYQVGSGTTITISWNLPSGVTGLLQDFFGGIVVNKSMSGKDSLVVSNPGIVNKLKMTITYNLTGNLPPSAPNLISPSNGSINVDLNPTLRWTQVSGSTNYHLQIAKDSIFTQIVFNDSTITSNSKEIQLQSKTKYFWRVRAKNNAGWSPFSSIWNFTTRPNLPSPPNLYSPQKGSIGVTIPVEFKWFSSAEAENYSLIVSEDSNFTILNISETVFDTFYVASNLETNKKYFWKVIANNLSGSSSDSEIWYFTTVTTSVEDVNLPTKFILYQNYPNPFNPITKINYHLPVDSFTKFLIYNSIGQKIFDLDLGFQKAGSHKIELDFSQLKSNREISGGIYFYKLIANQNASIKKMIYLK